MWQDVLQCCIMGGHNSGTSSLEPVFSGTPQRTVSHLAEISTSDLLSKDKGELYFESTTSDVNTKTLWMQKNMCIKSMFTWCNDLSQSYCKLWYSCLKDTSQHPVPPVFVASCLQKANFLVSLWKKIKIGLFHHRQFWQSISNYDVYFAVARLPTQVRALSKERTLVF